MFAIGCRFLPRVHGGGSSHKNRFGGRFGLFLAIARAFRIRGHRSRVRRYDICRHLHMSAWVAFLVLVL